MSPQDHSLADAFDFSSYGDLGATASPLPKSSAARPSPTREGDELSMRIHRKVLDSVKLEELSKLPEEQQRIEIRTIAERLIDVENLPFSGNQRAQFIQDLLDEIVGFGPLENSAARPEHQRHPGQWPQPGLHRAHAADLEEAPVRLSRRTALAARSSSGSCARSDGASIRCRRWSTRVCRTARA